MPSREWRAECLTPYDLADAVIAELGLRLERASEWPHDIRPWGDKHTRYITDWKADDE